MVKRARTGLLATIGCTLALAPLTVAVRREPRHAAVRWPDARDDAALAGAPSAPAPLTFPLYDVPPAGWEHPAQSEASDSLGPGMRVLRNVTVPTVTAYLPAPGHATGAGVVIAPGGGFVVLSIDHEGNDVARWLAAHGVAAFVLKYRLFPSPRDRADFEKFFAKQIAANVAHLDEPSPGQAEASADGRAALARVRARAASFGVDPARVGFLGFSAGGAVALDLALDGTSRPAFVGVIYAALASKAVVPRDAPPMFAALADDDPLFGNMATSIYDAWHAAHRPVELHVYAAGGHGFGMHPQGTTSDTWIESFYAWLQAGGFTGR